MINYQDTITFVVVKSSGYGGNKQVLEQIDVPCVFLQNVGITRPNFQETLNSDATCYPDPENEFIKSYANRLEGMYLRAILFGSSDGESWYKVDKAIVNRDHLLTNQVDNIELLLKKTTPITGVS